MIRIVLTLLCTTIIFLSSCSDESDTAYTGPWEIEYREFFEGTHKDSPQFKEWFYNHRSGKIYFRLILKSGTSWDAYDAEAWGFFYSDYDKLMAGDIIWVEVIEQATEQEMQVRIDEFEAFSEPKDKDGNYKICTAHYVKYIESNE